MKSALLAVDIKMTAAQRMMLTGHYQHRVASTEKIARCGGYRTYSAGNLQYGILCGRIASELGFVPPRSKIYAIATVSNKRDDEGHFQWRMDSIVRKAIEELGWAEKSTT
jgi:predicted HNH restriction endonuclease